MPIPPAPRRVAIVRQRRALLQWVRCIGLKGSRGAMHLKRRLVSTFTLAAFVTLLPSLPTTQASKGPPSTRVADVSNIKIGNFGQVNANYYRGDNQKTATMPPWPRGNPDGYRPPGRWGQRPRSATRRSCGDDFPSDPDGDAGGAHARTNRTVHDHSHHSGSPAGLCALRGRQAPHGRHDGGLPNGA